MAEIKMVKINFSKINIKNILFHRRAKIFYGLILIIASIILLFQIKPINNLSDLLQYKFIENKFGPITEKLSKSEVYFFISAIVTFILGSALIIWSIAIKKDTFTHKPDYYVDKLKLLGIKKADSGSRDFTK